MIFLTSGKVREIVREENLMLVNTFNELLSQYRDQTVGEVMRMLNVQLNMMGHEGRIIYRSKKEEEEIAKRR